MASRRSRLKAVANLPIRRKTLSVQQEVENSNAQDALNAETNTEVSEKEKEPKECDENRAESSDTADIASTGETAVIAQSEPAKTCTDEVLAEDNVQKNIKPTQSFRFGRRVKPTVSLANLKERTPKAENKNESAKESAAEEQVEKESSTQIENQEDCVNKSPSKSDNLNSSDSDLLKTIQPVVEETTPLTCNPNDGNADQSETVSTPAPTISGDSTENAIVIAVPVISPKESTSSLNSVNKTASDVVPKQKCEVLSQRNLSDNFQLVSQVNQVQLTTTAVKKTTSGGVKQKKPKFNDFARKVADARREFQRKYEKIPPDRNSLRMIDLIFYNPSTNPME